MKNFNSYLMLTTSLKGGGGKSTLACALLDQLRHHGIPTAAYDADGAIGSLSDMHAQRDNRGRKLDEQDALHGVVGYNIRDESRALLVNSLGFGHRHILHDVAGGALVDLQRLFSDRDSLRNFSRALRDCDTCLVFLHLVTPDNSTIESVALHLDLTDALGDLAGQTRHVAVLNRHGDRTDQDFPMWFGYTDTQGTMRGGKTRQRLLDGGGAEMSLPALNERTMALLKELRMPFAQACRDRRLTLIGQQRISIFCEDFNAAMSPQVRQLIGL
jgi:hypothetical protein